MYQAIDPTATVLHSLEWDTGENPIMFMVGVVDSSLMAHIEDAHTTYVQSKNGEGGASDIRLNLNRKNYEVVRFGLKGWTGFSDKKGELKFETARVKVPGIGERDAVTDDCMKRLSLRAISSIAQKVRNFSDLTETAEKN